MIHTIYVFNLRAHDNDSCHQQHYDEVCGQYPDTLKSLLQSLHNYVDTLVNAYPMEHIRTH